MALQCRTSHFQYPRCSTFALPLLLTSYWNEGTFHAHVNFLQFPTGMKHIPSPSPRGSGTRLVPPVSTPAGH